MFRRHFLRWILLPAVLAGNALPVSADTLSWPAPPARARVKYVAKRDISPVTASRGFFAKLFDFLFGGVDQEIPQFGQPSAVLWGRSGDLFVSDLANARVYRVPADGTPWIELGKNTRPQLGTPVGISMVGDTVVVVDAETKKISLFLSDGTFIRSFATGLRRPVSVTADAGRLFVADALGCTVHVFDPEGHDLRSLAERGDSASALNTPTNIARYRDTLFVVDAMNFRITELTIDGRFVRSFGLAGDAPGTFTRPRGIAVDPDEHLYVVDGLQDCVNVFDQSGGYLMSFGITGSSGPGQFQLPAGIAINDDGLIAVADSHNHCVQIFQYIR